MPHAVQFGAGNIGRGFIAQLFHESSLDIVFVDVAPEIIEAVNKSGSYSIQIVGPGAEEVRIDRIRAVDGSDSGAVAEAVAGCEIACTAVGARALPHIAPNIAAGLRLRYERGADSLNILICENLHDAAAVLRDLVSQHLPPDSREYVLERTGFVQAVVSRMVPLQEPSPGDPLSIRVEAYKRLPVDGAAVVGTLAPIIGVEPVPNFRAHVERKLFTHNCAHATLGYAGWIFGLTYGWEALRKPHLIWRLKDVLDETGEALVKRHGFDPDEQSAYERDLLDRFANRELGDTCFRLARDPLRKLAPGDRLVGALRLCQEEGVSFHAVASIVGCALAFDSADDLSALELQRRLKEDGIDAVLKQVCAIDSQEEAALAIREAYTLAVDIRESIRAGAELEE